MKKLLIIFVLTLTGIAAFAQDATFNACAGKTFTLKTSEIFDAELAEIDDLATYEQELTYTCHTNGYGSTGCGEGCDGFVQQYYKTDSTVELVYNVTLRLRKDYLTHYTFEKEILVRLHAAPTLQFGSNPLSL
ncbi:MAG: hypothetical protein J6Z12_06580 [Paludibacteraceae bacterium]|nr:hypothetical protein [Paludibacteraceae bacterium]